METDRQKALERIRALRFSLDLTEKYLMKENKTNDEEERRQLAACESHLRRMLFAIDNRKQPVDELKSIFAGAPVEEGGVNEVDIGGGSLILNGLFDLDYLRKHLVW